MHAMSASCMLCQWHRAPCWLNHTPCWLLYQWHHAMLATTHRVGAAGTLRGKSDEMHSLTPLPPPENDYKGRVKKKLIDFSIKDLTQSPTNPYRKK